MINAVMMGLSRAEARRRFDDIIAFAELEEFVDLKLKNYSSGMGVRLGFAVATQVDAEVLLVDEVLAVGDASFQQKCFEVFQRLKDAGKTILFVTHDMGLVERFCDRAMLIERGNVLSIGDPHEIGLLYNQVNFGGLVHDAPTREAAPAAGRDQDLPVRGRGRGGERAAARRDLRHRLRDALQRADRESRLRRVAAQRGRPDRVRHHHAVGGSADRRVRGRRVGDRARPARRLVRPGPLPRLRPRWRARAAAPTRSTCARTWPP